MKLEPVQVAKWPGNFHSPVRLLVKAGVGLSFVLATTCSVRQWHHAVDRQYEKYFQVSCQHVEPVDKTRACIDFRTCSACKQTFPILQFPAKGGGRREGRCCDCHNIWRRNKYKAIAKTGPYANGKLNITQLDESHAGLNTILDLICDEIIRKEIAI